MNCAHTAWWMCAHSLAVFASRSGFDILFMLRSLVFQEKIRAEIAKLQQEESRLVQSESEKLPN